jgi:tetratricopeptide (TPR) repeat protein
MSKFLISRFKYGCIVQMITLVLTFIICSNTASAATESYTYSTWANAEAAPPAYELDQSLHASDLGVDSLSSINGIFYRKEFLYIASNDFVAITDKNFKLIHIIKTFLNNGEEYSFISPTGVFVTEKGEIYVADPEKGAIFHFDKNYKLIRILERPEMTGLEGINYQPVKVVVDEIGRIYVLAKNAYEGIIELNPSGGFNRYLGANRVSITMLDLFWRSIATEKQLSQMALWLPTDYSDVALDKDGFIFATVQGTDSKDPVRKLNSKGIDIMREYDQIPRPSGDLVQAGTKSNLTSVACANDGRFAVLDSTRSRVFVYNDEARLLYIFGGNGTTAGQFRNPIDVIFMEDKILVADSITASIEVFSPTEYGAFINEATYYQGIYEYDKAATAWEKVALMNPNFDYAYVGIGKQELREKDYESAAEAFYESKDLEYYSSSFTKVREAFLEDNFNIVLIIILALILIVIIKKVVGRFLRKRGFVLKGKVMDYLNAFRDDFIHYPLYILSHPFKGFDEIKYEKKGKLSVCISIIAILSLINIIRFNSTSFLINENNPYEINSILLILTTVFPYLLFVTANWSITTLIDGKGTYSDIFKINMYALYPKIYLDLLGIGLSNVLILEELPIVYMLFGISTFLYCFYTFIGLVVIHGFSFSKGMGSVILTFAAMAVIVFILLLLVTLVGGFTDDIYTIVQEFTLLF